ncbi:SacI homology domain-containing protein [Cunninghamella echinulata]|nr:SacI homology domain-containing protein [Cunninghamella echinulata]
MIYEKIRLIATNDSYIFTPLFEPASSNQSPIQTLTIDRHSKEFLFDDAYTSPLGESSILSNELVIYGILGFCQLQADTYMVVITDKIEIGTICNSKIYRVTSFQILPIKANWEQYSEQLLQEEQKFINLLESQLQLNSFYFSYTYKLTNSLQRQSQKVDDRFFWNQYLSQKMLLIDDYEKINSFILPVIQGFISITPLIINQKPITLALISRRSQERAGTRYFSRGIDERGHVSNYVETEQIIIYNDHHHHENNSSNTSINQHHIRFSYVQTRGSLPLFWGQIPNIRYVPRLWYESDISIKLKQSAKLHFEQQIQLYGSQILINLVNTTGYEKPLGEQYARIVQELDNPYLYYTHYDFHRECKKMQWHRIQILIDDLGQKLEDAGYYYYDENKNIEKTQTGVARTNCIDCLDRTNVVQTMLAKRMIDKWGSVLGLQLNNDPLFIRTFNSAWADNADSLSIAYSSTRALKTDYTRFGKRTVLGLYNDFTNSLIRYIKNNYFDGDRQDAIDLFLGRFNRDNQDRIETYTIYAPKYALWKIQTAPCLLISSFCSFFWLLFFFDGSISPTLYICLLSFCFTMIVFTWCFILQNGLEFINWPTLNPLYIGGSKSSSHISNNNNQQPLQQSSVPLSFLTKNWILKFNSEAIDEIEQGKKLEKMS